MNAGDIVAVASFTLSIAAIILMLGKNIQRLEVAEKDLNKLGEKIERDFINLNAKADQNFRELDSRLDQQANNLARGNQRILYLEERVFSEETIARMRE